MRGAMSVLRRPARVLAVAVIFAWSAAAVLAADSRPVPLLSPMPGTPEAPDFSLGDLDGGTVRLSDLRGQVVIVNFWATWCPPCRFEIPSMQRTWDAVRGTGIVLLAVHVGGDEDKVWQFATDYAVDFPVLLDPDSAVTDAWPVIGLPTTFVVDPSGRIAYRAIGGREWDDPRLLDQIKQLRPQ